MPRADPRLQILMQMLQQQLPLDKAGDAYQRDPRGSLLPGTAMQLMNPNTNSLAAGQTMTPNALMAERLHPPYQTNDQGQPTIDTPADALFLEGQRRLKEGEVMYPPGGTPGLAPKISEPPPLDPNVFPGLEDFLSPGGG